MDPIARGRLNARMQETLAELLSRQVKDPRVADITLTGVEVSNDATVANVYYSLIGGEEQRRLAQRGLVNVAGFLRGEIGRRLHLRSAPELRFHFDASLEQGQRIETLLRQWHEEKPAERGAAENFAGGAAPATDAGGGVDAPGQEDAAGGATDAGGPDDPWKQG